MVLSYGRLIYRVILGFVPEPSSSYYVPDEIY